MIDTQEIIGIYGAVVATGTFFWQGFQWLGENPKLRIDVRTDIVIDVSSGIAFYDHQGRHAHDKKGIMVEIVNIGKIPTTIRSVSIQGYMGRCGFKERHNFAYFPIKDNPILKPGEIWSTFHPNQTKIFEFTKEYNLFVEVSHSFSNTLIKKKIIFLEDRQ